MMRSLLVIITLAGCAPPRPVVTWVSTITGLNERVEVRSNGDVRYTTTSRGVTGRPQELKLSKEQVEELGDLLRTQRACELAHDPSFTPMPDEGQTTLEVAFPDMRCKIVLWNREWQRDRSREIVDTLRSMRPLRH